MFGQMTAGSWIYIGTPGNPPGHLPDVLRRGRGAFRLARPLGTHRAHRRARRHGRRPAARRDDGRSRDPLRRGRPALDRPSARDALPRRAGRLARRRAGSRARRGGGTEAALGRAARERGRRPAELVARGETFDLVTDQTAAHDPLTGYVPAEVPFEEAAALRERDPRGVPAAGVRSRSWRTSARWSSSSGWGATFSTMATTCEVRPIERA